MRHWTRKHRDAACRLSVIGLLLLLVGCADSSGNSRGSDNDRNSGFYGGVTGGGSRL
ncbi:MAG: hypothetical protein JO081_18245 [Alphaproteobacteria bacterium]|nr:hypothetical protein [Alphaproteobacteria bacterium]